jgi:hypothetical protein
VEKTKYKFGPASLRKYMQLACLEKKVFDELGLIGDTLGTDGFVNMSAIRADHDKELYFFRGGHADQFVGRPFKVFRR